MRARRALLYTPGDDLHKIEKAISLDVDCICLDLEDGVAATQKESARETISEVLISQDFGKSERLVRINPVGSGLENDDLEAILPSKPDGIVLPKVTGVEQIKWLIGQISAHLMENEWSPDIMAIFVIIESALAIVNLREIASSDPSLDVLIFGAEDLAADVGSQRSNSAWEVFHARSKVVTYAAAYGLQAIDMVYLDFTDSSGLRVQANQGSKLGYVGKQVIHPDQVDIVQSIFTPDIKSIDAANEILVAYAAHQEAGQGAFSVDGKMIDAPVVKSAQNIIERAKAAGRI
jgi:citrate lyase subunit beta-like protein